MIRTTIRTWIIIALTITLCVRANKISTITTSWRYLYFFSFFGTFKSWRSYMEMNLFIDTWEFVASQIFRIHFISWFNNSSFSTLTIGSIWICVKLFRILSIRWRLNITITVRISLNNLAIISTHEKVCAWTISFVIESTLRFINIAKFSKFLSGMTLFSNEFMSSIFTPEYRFS